MRCAFGGSGNKTFTDESLPLGTDSVQYIVTAIRGSVNGIPSNAFTVQFGVGGEFVVGSSTANVKLAAQDFASRLRDHDGPDPEMGLEPLLSRLKANDCPKWT